MTIVAFAALISIASRAAAADCQAMLENHAPVFEMTFELPRNGHVQRKLLLPAADVIVFANEHGLDARLEIRRGKDVITRADSPMARYGTQRAALRTARGASYSLHILGKEHSPALGRVDVRVVAFAQPSNDRCVELHSALARGDERFAKGQMVTLGLATDSQTDATSEYRLSAQSYAQAASSLLASGPSALLGEAQQAEGEALSWAADVEPACLAAARAARTYEAIGDSYRAAKSNYLLASALYDVSPATTVDCGARSPSESRVERMKRLFADAAAFHGQRKEIYDQALATNYLALAFWADDDLKHALPLFAEALKLHEQAGERQEQAVVLQNLALADRELGRSLGAMQRFAQALTLLRKEEDPATYVGILNNYGYAATLLGEHDAALRHLRQGLALSREIQDRYWEVTILDNIGLVYDRIGDQELAIDFYNQSLRLGDASFASASRTNTLSKLATILRSRQAYDQAIAARREALALTTALSTKQLLWIHLAGDYRSAGELDQATAIIDALFTKPEAPLTDFTRGMSLLERGQIAHARRDSARAEKDFAEARKLFRSLGTLERELEALIGLARSQQLRGQSDAALTTVDSALRIGEEIRVRSANPELRAKLLEASRPAFDLKLSLLAKRYFAESSPPRAARLAREILRVSEQARARALADFGRLDMSADASAAKLMEERDVAYSELSSRRQQLESLLAASTDNPRVELIRADIATLRQQVTDLDAQLAAASVGKTNDDGPQEIDLTAIPNDVVLLGYWMGQDRSLVLSVTREGIVPFDLGPSADISGAAMALHNGMQNFGSTSVAERLQNARRLHDLVLRPIGSTLVGKSTLFVVADGALHYVPFGVLQGLENGRSRFVIETHDVAVAPSLGRVIQGLHGPDPQGRGRLLLVSDPIYTADDARLVRKQGSRGADEGAPSASLNRSSITGSGVRKFRRLPGTATEAKAIRALFKPGLVDGLEGSAATRARFLASPLPEYRFIHIASHATADAEIPQLSAVILSTVDTAGAPINGHVLAADFLRVRLNADLVVLSGCESAVGKRVAGEGLIGLQYVMVARGARNVVSSLWQVPDRYTAEMMTRFYTDLLRGNRTPRRALGNAMRSLLADGLDPSFWSAFSLTSEVLD